MLVERATQRLSTWKTLFTHVAKYDERKRSRPGFQPDGHTGMSAVRTLSGNTIFLLCS